jgi:hypothetical protein
MPNAQPDGTDTSALRRPTFPVCSDQYRHYMANALFAFESRADAQRSVDQLIAQGLPEQSVQLHAHPANQSGQIPSEADEVATGGFITNFLEMFEGVFEWGGSPHDASAYAAVVRRGGGVISVDVSNDEDRAKVDAAMQQAGCTQRTEWSDLPAR